MKLVNKTIICSAWEWNSSYTFTLLSVFLSKRVTTNIHLIASWKGPGSDRKIPNQTCCKNWLNFSSFSVPNKIIGFYLYQSSNQVEGSWRIRLYEKFTDTLDILFPSFLFGLCLYDNILTWKRSRFKILKETLMKKITLVMDIAFL